MSQKTCLVVSAHAADFVWRAGGSIALHAKLGYQVTVVCLSYGERGESAKLWKLGDITVDRVKHARRAEAERAAQIVDVSDLQFWDVGDYPMIINRETLFRLVDVFRRIQPAFVLSHSQRDIYNYDHPAATDLTQQARIIAQAHGHNPHEKVIGAPPVFLFEPHQPEQCGWIPSVFLDITSVWDKKRKAIECMTGQEHLWDYYTRVALQRGAQAARNSDRSSIAYGEAFEAVFPRVVEALA